MPGLARKTAYRAGSIVTPSGVSGRENIDFLANILLASCRTTVLASRLNK